VISCGGANCQEILPVHATELPGGTIAKHYHCNLCGWHLATLVLPEKPRPKPAKKRAKTDLDGSSSDYLTGHRSTGSR
jgi:hypothetical protein